jgi:hypothetical protein
LRLQRYSPVVSAITASIALAIMEVFDMRSLKIRHRFPALVSAGALLVFVSPCWAAVTANSIVSTQIPKAYKAQLTNTSGTTAVNLVTPGSNGTKVISVVCSSTDSSGHNVTFSIARSSTSYVLGSVAIAASAGSLAGTPSASILNATNIPGIPLDSDGNPYLFLEATDTLQMASGSAVTAGKVISCNTVAADF